MKPNYARLYVILARDASKAIIFRQGPSEWVQLILWHTNTDTFEAGQWFHGQILHNWSDLSPDGKKLLYLASKHYILKTVDPEYTTGWTAISKPPYFTALALWPHASGGYFSDNNTVYLGYWRGDPPHRSHQPPPSLNVLSQINRRYGPDVPVQPLELSGWTEVQEVNNLDPIGTPNGYRFQTPWIWQKDKGDFRIIRKEIGHERHKYGGSRLREFTLQYLSDSNEIPIDTDAWADWDQQGRLVYVNQGQILAGKIENGIINPQLLADFNANKPQSIISPDWAKVWDDETPHSS